MRKKILAASIRSWIHVPKAFPEPGDLFVAELSNRRVSYPRGGIIPICYPPQLLALYNERTELQPYGWRR
jgi:hypothetical protein